MPSLHFGNVTTERSRFDLPVDSSLSSSVGICLESFLIEVRAVDCECPRRLPSVVLDLRRRRSLDEFLCSCASTAARSIVKSSLLRRSFVLPGP